MDSSVIVWSKGNTINGFIEGFNSEAAIDAFVKKETARYFDTILSVYNHHGCDMLHIGEVSLFPQPDISMIYIAGPFSSDRIQGTANAEAAGAILFEHGVHPIYPHRVGFETTKLNPKLDDYERWMEYDLDLLRRCDALVVLGGSRGVQREVNHARREDKHVFRGISEVVKWKKSLTKF